ncbi:MAG: hypothetical protein WBH86_05370 [Thermogutta sp.]|nr:hypothetical protein [Thermogutta sp.]HQF13719.1 hypothetical protein [Thermogutta sp.]
MNGEELSELAALSLHPWASASEAPYGTLVLVAAMFWGVTPDDSAAYECSPGEPCLPSGDDPAETPLPAPWGPATSGT